MNAASEIISVPVDLHARLQQIRQRIALACQQVGRDLADVNLLAVSKTQPAQQVATLAALGVADYGENYWQEAQSKQNTLRSLDIRWHFIGAIQSNKAKLIAQNFAWVHSVSSIAVAEKLSAARDPQQAPLQVCIQVNLDQEISKAGVEAAKLEITLSRIIMLQNLCVRGLMLLPAQVQEASERFARFSQLADLLNQVNKRYVSSQHPLDTLSMGMSDDLELAVAAGSHWLRIGSALFGSRNRK